MMIGHGYNWIISDFTHARLFKYMKFGPPNDFYRYMLWVAFVLIWMPVAVFILRIWLALGYALLFGHWPF